MPYAYNKDTQQINLDGSPFAVMRGHSFIMDSALEDDMGYEMAEFLSGTRDDLPAMSSAYFGLIVFSDPHCGYDLLTERGFVFQYEDETLSVGFRMDTSEKIANAINKKKQKP